MLRMLVPACRLVLPPPRPLNPLGDVKRRESGVDVSDLALLGSTGCRCQWTLCLPPTDRSHLKARLFWSAGPGGSPGSPGQPITCVPETTTHFLGVLKPSSLSRRNQGLRLPGFAAWQPGLHAALPGSSICDLAAPHRFLARLAGR